MQRHCQNTLHVARLLEEHPAVSWLHAPGLPEDPLLCADQALFAARRGRDLHLRCQERVCSHLAHVGEARSLLIHPARTTHQPLSVEDQRAGA